MLPLLRCASIVCFPAHARPIADPAAFLRPPPETFRNQQKTTNDRPKLGEGGVPLNQENRRPPHDRNGSRNAASTPRLFHASRPDNARRPPDPPFCTLALG